MKIKNIIVPFLASAALLMTSCGETADKNAFTVTGKVDGDKLNGKEIYLQKLDPASDQFIGVDTVTIENGTFVFKGSAANGADMGFISFEGLSKPAPFILEAGNIEIALDSALVPSVKGTDMNQKYQDFIVKQQSLDKEDAPMSEYQKVFYEYIKSNISNPVGQYFLMYRGGYLDAAQLKDLLSVIPEGAIKSYPRIQKLMDRLPVLEATSVGQMFTDLKGKTPDGKEIALSDYAGKGKYVLVDFWASWCPPCRKEMPHIVELYNKYKAQGFEIVGVSLDDKNADWEKGIKDLNISWAQISDLKGWKSDLAAAYAVNSIPQTFLLDKDGKIIAKGLNAEELSITLEELLK